jgi:hypothetical protein
LEEERLRITPGALHTDEMILQLVEGLCDAFDHFGIPRKYAREKYQTM